MPTAVRADILRHLWTVTVTKMGLKGLRFHDLRHAGNTEHRQASKKAEKKAKKKHRKKDKKRLDGSAALDA